MTNTNLNTLPTEIIEKVKNTLKIYPRAYVVYEDGRYNVSAGIALKAIYSEDHKFIGEYLEKEVFNENERIINYVENFHEYPINYKGKRDYKFINALTWDDKVKLDENGDIVKA